MSSMSREWAFSMAFSLLLMLVFGMGLVWLNIERVDMAYEITRLQGEIDQATALSAKLEVERDTLITPGRLRELAVQFGLGPAKSGQIRWVGESGESIGDTKAADAVQARGNVANAAEKAASAKPKGGQRADKAAKAARPAPDTQAPYEN
ncbi:hypothetical protein G3N56_04755 [Desulfovibrio sulfodismutans]|uniref:Cell division protein FtsL n=1 Tax=Desulfolutivibrio sulfodismutans TaxID=63561 RepID=A0A7K3NJX8_9BACT|nr:hypothetical protein [Desulfolutivibrio sulfodismutans]NDY56055.1 hypothetical protein [Desulfolutivibrio sulfodismutans]QLA12311.1 hypothetical protein GD606_08520 [Desulfolutivibrio sulfodismutans DSM 3696]